MDKTVVLEQIVAVDDILHRWHKSAEFLNGVAKRNGISFFARIDSRIRPTDGKEVHFCSPLSSIWCIDFSKEWYDTENVFMRPEDVAAYEKEHPEVLWEPAHPEAEIVKEYGENIPADIVRRWLKMSPMQFIDFMNSGQGPVCSWEEGFRKHSEDLYPDGPFFTTKDLQNENFTFHVLDWLNWQKAMGGRGKASGGEEGDTATALRGKASPIAELEAALKTELGQAQQEKAALQAELEKTRAELEQARHEAPPQGMTPQQKAALARSEKALNAWKPAIAAMIEIATVIGKEGPKERQTPDLYVYFNERDIAITDEQMKLFRKALPAEYKDTEGGPVGKI